MALNKTKWKYSEEKPMQDNTQFIEPVEGPQYAVIRKASHDEDSDVYKLGLHSFQNNAYINLTYYLTTTNQDGIDEPNARNRRTMISLTKALMRTEYLTLTTSSDARCSSMSRRAFPRPSSRTLSPWMRRATRSPPNSPTYSTTCMTSNPCTHP